MRYSRQAAYAVAIASAVSAAAAQSQERTGTRVGSDAAQRTVVQLNQPDEIDAILERLDAGDAAGAVARARAYVASLDSQTPGGRSSPSAGDERYYALNALCVALTKAGEVDEAVTTCTAAIEINPRRWTAINSRGTAHFAARRFDDALTDYRRALEAVPPDDPNHATVERNIELAEARLEGASPPDGR